MKPTKAPLLLILALGLLALAGGGCGGGGGSSSSEASTPSTQSTTQSAAAGPKSQQGKGASHANANSKGNSQKHPSAASGQQAPSATATPLSSANDRKAIEGFGSEASSAERSQATAAVSAYLSAESAKNWDGACAYLTSQLQRGFAKLGDNSPLSKGSGCGGGLAVLFAKAPQATLRDAVLSRSISLRVLGPQGYLIYRNAADKPTYMPVQREGGNWRMRTPTGVPMTP